MRLFSVVHFQCLSISSSEATLTMRATAQPMQLRCNFSISIATDAGTSIIDPSASLSRCRHVQARVHSFRIRKNPEMPPESYPPESLSEAIMKLPARSKETRCILRTSQILRCF